MPRSDVRVFQFGLGELSKVLKSQRHVDLPRHATHCVTIKCRRLPNDRISGTSLLTAFNSGADTEVHILQLSMGIVWWLRLMRRWQ
jgi:hypothetical protein